VQLVALIGESGRVSSWMSLSVRPPKAAVPAWQAVQAPRPLNVSAAWQALQTAGVSGMFGCTSVA
jgi:hypothetical protein